MMTTPSTPQTPTPDAPWYATREGITARLQLLNELRWHADPTPPPPTDAEDLERLKATAADLGWTLAELATDLRARRSRPHLVKIQHHIAHDLAVLARAGIEEARNHA